MDHDHYYECAKRTSAGVTRHSMVRTVMQLPGSPTMLYVVRTSRTSPVCDI